MPSMAELPAGTVTFLFSDIEGSTRLWEEHPDAMRECLARHDEIMRLAVTTHDGVIVKTTGDGVHAAFPTAAGGVAAAIDAQRAITTSSWDAIGGLKARIGLHTGEAELRDGDYYGSELNRAARLMSVAHGDQIVVSQLTGGLVRDALPEGVELVDLGEHRLRDVATPIQVFQVTHPDLPREFPRLRSLQDAFGNLPAQLTSFVGRDEELAALAQALGRSHLVTLTGTGGVGKTRLAVQVATELASNFADGAWVCELAAADDDQLMAQVIGNALGCQQRPGLSLHESIVEYLKVRKLLLVLDNCEHLLDDAGDLAASVLRTCPDVKVLATSREALEVDGERVVRVKSLEESAAVRMFDHRARDAGATTAWTDEQWNAIAEICRRVDGIPLAIELAAARVEAMSPVEIAAHLDERFRILTGKRRGRVERQQTLRATVDWSYQLLGPDERAVFDRLGIFSGSFDAEAAGAVVSDDAIGGWQVREAVADLVAKSMLVAEDGPGGTTRYSMLETLRVFARDQLDQSDDTDVWRRRHAAHFADFAEAVAVGITGHDDRLWLARLVANFDNVRAAVVWALDRDDREDTASALRMLAALAPFGQWDRSTSLGAIGARAVEAVMDEQPAWRSPILSLASYHEMNQGRPERALELARDSMRDGIVEHSAHPSLPIQNLAFAELMTGNHERAGELIDEGRVAFTAGDYVEAVFLGPVSTFLTLLGRRVEARSCAQRAVELARGIGNYTLLTQALSGLAWATYSDDPQAALETADEIIARIGDGLGAGIFGSALALAGGLRARLGGHDEAVVYLHRAALAARDDGVRPQLAGVLDWSVPTLVATDRPEVAAVLLGAVTEGTLAEVSSYTSVVVRQRADALAGVRTTLGDAEVDALVARGAAMTYDEIAAYAIEQLAPVAPAGA
jgi:predicted ATPase/class 3 adenylate cyclase